MKTLRVGLLVVLFIGFVSASAASTAEILATASMVPSPKALPSVPSAQWCKIVDAVLANPNATDVRRAEYIAAGQANHCPHQMLMEPVSAPQKPQTPEQWCTNAFMALNNPAVDRYAKEFILEKARNRGCLK